MRLREFIRQNREVIDAAVIDAYGSAVKPSNDREREQWIMNYEALYLRAKRAGVHV